MSLNESIRIIKKLSLIKGVNVSVLHISYFFSKLMRKNLHKGWPMSIAIEPTTSCNLRCPECPSGLRNFSRPTGMLDPLFFQSTINQLKDHLIYLTFYFQGEPYLNPSFLTMVKYAAERKIYTSTSTNAHYLKDENARLTVESGLDRLIISIDGSTQETYENYRVGGQLKKVIEGAKSIVKWKKKLKSKSPYVIFQFLVVLPNQHQIEDIKRLAEEIGVDEVKFKTAQVYEYENGNKLIPTIQKYSRYKKNDNGKYTLKNELLNSCWKMWNSCVITWDGKMVPCCFDKDASHQLGELKHQSFEEIWKGEKYNLFRKSVLNSRKEIDICKNCSEGTKVWI